MCVMLVIIMRKATIIFTLHDLTFLLVLLQTMKKLPIYMNILFIWLSIDFEEQELDLLTYVQYRVFPHSFTYEIEE